MASGSKGETMVDQHRADASAPQLLIAPCILPPPRAWLVDGGDTGASNTTESSASTEKETQKSVVPTKKERQIKPDETDFPDPMPEIRETPVTLTDAVSQPHTGNQNKIDSIRPPTMQQIGAPSPAPSWEELSKQVLPAAARELLSSALQRLVYYSKRSAAACRWQRAYTDYYGATGTVGYYRAHNNLPAFSTLPWVDRQMVAEWRTYLVENDDPPDSEAAEELEFQRARTLVPPPTPRPIWKNAQACAACRKTFGPTLLRHHCRVCGDSFCHQHSSQSIPLPALQYTIPERVCDACCIHLRSQSTAERIAWRLARCRDFSHNTLAPYFDVGVDSVEDAALRITHAAIAMAKAIPLGAQATVAVETLDVLRKYGLNGIYTTIMLRQEFLAAADLLLKVLGIDRAAFPLSVHELAAAIFYAFCEHRAARGSYPELEHTLHAPDTIKEENLEAILMYAPMALQFVYMPKAVDMQLLAAQQGWRLLYAHLVVDDYTPASALFVHETKKIACLSIRGTTTIQDVITDIRQVPVPFPETAGDEDGWETVFRGQGLAVSGMASAASSLYREHIDSLLVFSQAGYKIRLVGHSLGGSVATLLGVLLQNEVKTNLHVYAYGSPSCVDLALAKAVDAFVTSVVLHDDVIPRLTPTSCRTLLKHLLMIRETWVKPHFADDIKAFTDRAKRAWAPRWRGGFTLPPKDIENYCREKLHAGKKYVKATLLPEQPKGASTKGNGTIIDQEDDFLVSPPSEVLSLSVEESISSPLSATEPSAAVQVEERRTLSFDGDEFYDPQEENHAQEWVSGDTMPDSASIARSDCNVEEKSPSTPAKKVIKSVPSDDSFGSDGSPGAVVLEETPLPDMYIPGKIVHIYAHRGLYRASYVPRDFSELRRVSLAPNLLTDHRTKSYYDALLEVFSVRHATENPPQWTTFDGDKTCACCASEFTWASTSNNRAQEARDKHNCRSCGALVCDPCSKNRIPIPSIGLAVPSRVCDRCYNDMGSTTSKQDAAEGLQTDDGRPNRMREKRSSVVDELASRVQASALKC